MRIGMRSVTEQQPKRTGPKRSADPDEAFAYWWHGGETRSQREVAEHYGVALRTVEKWSRNDEWPARAARLGVEARDAADKKLAQQAADRIRHNLGLIAATKAAYARRLKAGDVNVSPTELVALIKAEQLLTGGVTERTSDASGRDESQRAVLEAVADELGGLSVEQLEAEDKVDP